MEASAHPETALVGREKEQELLWKMRGEPHLLLMGKLGQVMALGGMPIAWEINGMACRDLLLHCSRAKARQQKHSAGIHPLASNPVK